MKKFILCHVTCNYLYTRSCNHADCKLSTIIPKSAVLEKIIGRNRLTLRRWWLAGKFPKPVKLNGNTLAWSSDIIDGWIEKSLRSSAPEHFD